MAYTLRLDEETETSLQLVMQKYEIATANKAIAFMINHYESLDSELDEARRDKEKTDNELNILIEAIKDKKLAEVIINNYVS